MSPRRGDLTPGSHLELLRPRFLLRRQNLPDFSVGARFGNRHIGFNRRNVRAPLTDERLVHRLRRNRRLQRLMLFT